jgi:hypothetical protein
MLGSNKARRHLHKRTVECDGFLREDGLWEVEARLVDAKPFAMRDSARGVMEAGDPVHEIRLRLAVDDDMIIREAEASMAATPYPSCAEVAPTLQRLVGERIGGGWRLLVVKKIGRLETCTHLTELLGPAVTTLFQMLPYGKTPEGVDWVDQQRGRTQRPFFLDGCYSWRRDGPLAASIFPEFATKPSDKD